MVEVICIIGLPLSSILPESTNVKSSLVTSDGTISSILFNKSALDACGVSETSPTSATLTPVLASLALTAILAFSLSLPPFSKDLL